MLKKTFLYFIIILSLFYFTLPTALACDTCLCSLSRPGGDQKSGDKNHLLFFDFMMEGQDWNEKPADEAHELHEAGHHVHDKTHEKFYHFSLRINPSEELTIFSEIPYVVRQSLEVEDEERLGEKETSEGIGDLHLTGIYRFLRKNNNFLGVVGGIKFPTGNTHEENSQHERFEPELQPGTGSWDYTVGSFFQYELNPLVLNGNVLYTFKTKGDQAFEFGDLFSIYLYADYLIDPASAFNQTKVGLDMNLQVEDKQIDHGFKMKDGGGITLLLGPSLTMKANDHISLFGNLLVPIYQNLGGVHQELDFVWNLGGKIAW